MKPNIHADTSGDRGVLTAPIEPGIKPDQALKEQVVRPSLPEAKKDTFRRIFKFFASLKLAICVLTSLMISMAAGTIVESLHGAEAARLVVYQSPWFNLILLLLGINVASAAFDRYPWQKKHTGFVITHLGIIIILIGSWITQVTMIDGQMPIEEGETSAFITLPEPTLFIAPEDNIHNRFWEVPLPKKPFAWQGEDKLRAEGIPFELALLTFYPMARMQESVISSETGPAAVEVELKNSFVDQNQWLVEKTPGYEEIMLGPAKLMFTDVLLQENAKPAPETGYLEFQFKDKSVQLPLDADLKLPATVALEGTPYSVILQRILRNAAVQGKNLIEEEGATEGEGKNPAVQFLLEGGGISERHTVFAKFPDFPTVHGMRPSEAGARVFYRLPNSGSRGESHELRFVADKDKGLIYQVKDGFEVRTDQVEVGKETGLGWMDLQFQVKQFYPHSRFERSFEAVKNTSENPAHISAVQMRIERAGEAQTLWLRQGFRESIQFGDKKYILVYGQKRIPLGFKIQLEDFKIENNPGTNQPASFASDVILKDDMRGISKPHNISMNEPLSHRGFKLYQSAYSLEPGKPEVSIFSVGKDPGIPIKYAGSIILVSGIVIMFAMRRFAQARETTK